MNPSTIISLLPYAPPFLFVDDILKVDGKSITGSYTFREDEFFYQGHFKNNPITPGVILTETMAQIGLVAFGIYLLNLTTDKEELKKVNVAMTSTQIDFFIPVLPKERVTVISEKEYLRFNKLKCNVRMLNAKEELVCRGSIAGMIII